MWVLPGDTHGPKGKELVGWRCGGAGSVIGLHTIELPGGAR